MAPRARHRPAPGGACPEYIKGHGEPGAEKPRRLVYRKERRAGVVTGRLRDRHRRGAGKAPYLLLTRCRPGAPLPDFSLTGEFFDNSQTGNGAWQRRSAAPLEGRVDSRRRRLDGWGHIGNARRIRRADTETGQMQEPDNAENSTMGKAPRAAAATPPASLRSAPSPQGGGIGAKRAAGASSPPSIGPRGGGIAGRRMGWRHDRREDCTASLQRTAAARAARIVAATASPSVMVLRYSRSRSVPPMPTRGLR
jgi:hypothetical protein